MRDNYNTGVKLLIILRLVITSFVLFASLYPLFSGLAYRSNFQIQGWFITVILSPFCVYDCIKSIKGWKYGKRWINGKAN